MGRKSLTLRRIDQAKAPDLRASLDAIQLASHEAQRIDAQTATYLIISRDAQLVRLSVPELTQGIVVE